MGGDDLANIELQKLLNEETDKRISLEEQLKEYKETSAMIEEELEREITDLSSRLEQERQNSYALEKKIEVLKKRSDEEIAQLENELRISNQTKEEIQKQNNELRQRLTRLEIETEQSETNIRIHESTLDEINKQNQILEEKVVIYESEIDHLRESHASEMSRINIDILHKSNLLDALSSSRKSSFSHMHPKSKLNQSSLLKRIVTSRRKRKGVLNITADKENIQVQSRKDKMASERKYSQLAQFLSSSHVVEKKSSKIDGILRALGMREKKSTLYKHRDE